MEKTGQNYVSGIDSPTILLKMDRLCLKEKSAARNQTFKMKQKKYPERKSDLMFN